jgi:hypothetical protein
VTFHGQTANSPASVYVKINGTKINYSNGAAATAMNLWKQWAIPLAGTGVNLKSVKSLTIGVAGGGKGTLFVDDIRLYAAAPAIATPADPGTTGLVTWYKMDGDVKDSSGKNYNGTINGTTSYETGVVGQALVFNGSNAYVDVPIGSLIPDADGRDLLDVRQLRRRHGCLAAGLRLRFGLRRHAVTCSCAALRTPPAACGSPSAPRRSRAGRSERQTVSEGWHHMAVTIDSKTMTRSRIPRRRHARLGATTVLPKDLGTSTQNWLGRSQYAPTRTSSAPWTISASTTACCPKPSCAIWPAIADQPLGTQHACM